MEHKKENRTGIVYSTEYGKMCPACNSPIAKCVCSKRDAVAKCDGIVRVGRETKGRKGKGVTVIIGIPLPLDELRVLAKHLKQKLGTGGTVKGGVIEIQGDHRMSAIEELNKQGYKAKCMGG